MSSEAWIRAQRLALLEHAAASLRKNRIEAEAVPNAQRLLERLEQLVPQTASASSGGSVTLEQTGVLNWLRTSGRSYYAGDPHAPDCGTREQIQFCDYYFMSANAITLNGERYNVDGSGNRVSALAYGPAHVVVIAGANKIVRDLAAAEQRVKLTAAPCNAARLHTNTGCAKTGFCVDCKTDMRMCCQTLITAFQRAPDRIRVFLLPDTYGF